MTEAAAPRRGASFWAFIVLMLALMALFIGLGTWQVQRLDEKERLIASVASRFELAPVPLPPVAEWPAFDTAAWAYRPVTLTGSYLPAGTVLVFTSLTEPNGPRSGPGYWVMTPLQLAVGGVVFINRGFVPQEQGTAFLGGGAPEAGTLTLTGIARAPEASGSFTPAADATNRIDWVRDPARLATLAGDLPGPVAPIYVDLPAGPEAALPQGGETVVSFPNNHLGYAITWFGFALLVPPLLWFWARRQR
jgi:surfeit locus 1 family protein